MVRFYLVPVEIINEIYRGPKYLIWRFGTGTLDIGKWSAMDYGFVPTMLVLAHFFHHPVGYQLLQAVLNRRLGPEKFTVDLPGCKDQRIGHHTLLIANLL